MFMVGYVMIVVILVKGFKYIGLDISFVVSLGWVLIGGLIVVLIGVSIFSCIYLDLEVDKDFCFYFVECIFVVLMIFIVCVMVFVYGFNDVVNVVGLLVVINSVIISGG